MSLAVAYWICLLLQLVLGLWGSWPVAGGNLRPAGGSLLLFLCLLLLGWKVFGPPLHS